MSSAPYMLSYFFFFFQAEDGIRDYKVTGVQTCALPISPFRHGYLRQYGVSASGGSTSRRYSVAAQWDGFGGVYGLPGSERSEERRVGKECRSRWSPYH